MYDGWSQDCCKCVVYHESTGNLRAEDYNENHTYDVGFWAINQINWAGCSGGQPPCSIQANLECAKKIWNIYKNWRPWSTCGKCNCCDKK